MKGTSYKLKSFKEPHLFTIQKLFKTNEYEESKIVEMYYIIGGTIYQAPSIFDVVNTRVTNVLNLVTTSYHEIKDKFNYSAINGSYVWNFNTNQNEEESKVQEIYTPFSSSIQNHVDKLIFKLEQDTKDELNEVSNKKRKLENENNNDNKKQKI